MKEVKVQTQTQKINKEKEMKTEERKSKKKKGIIKLISYFKESIRKFGTITKTKVPVTTFILIAYTIKMLEDKNILLKTIIKINHFEIKWFAYVVMAQTIFAWFEKGLIRKYKKKRRANILLFFIMLGLIILNPGGIYTSNTMLIITTIQLMLGVDQLKQIIK